MIYLQHPTEIQQVYYNACAHDPSGKPRFLNLQLTNPYHLNYTAMLGFIRNLHPFQFLKEGDKVVAVGIDPTFIRKQCSQAIIMLTIVGRNGHVHVIEGSPRNAQAIEQYIQEQHLRNIEVTQAIVSSDHHKVKFLENPKSSPMNMISLDKVSGKKQTALPLDEIVPVSYVPDFLYLTINGAEPEALSGAQKLLQKNPNLTIAYAIAFARLSTWYKPLEGTSRTVRKMHEKRVKFTRLLAESGYRIAIANGPHVPGTSKPFLFACATKIDETTLLDMGFKPSE